MDVELVSPAADFFYRPSPSPSRSGWARRAGSSCPACGRSRGDVLARNRSPPSTSRATSCGPRPDAVMPYDVLLVACGAVPVPALPGAADVPWARRRGDGAQPPRRAGGGRRAQVAFTVPWGVVWSLPAYELALMTAAHVAARGAMCRSRLRPPSRSRCSCSGTTAIRGGSALLAERDRGAAHGGVRVRLPAGTARLCREAGSTPSAWSRCRVCAGPGIAGLPQTRTASFR